jgi:selenocysteine-specific elongation factor
VPGHEHFIRNMVAGLCGVQCALIVVAADDGIMPQTAEHVQILNLLGIRNAAIAITKCDKVKPARVVEVTSAVEALLAPTEMKGSVSFPVSAKSGEGLAALANALHQMCQSPQPPAAGGRNFRMAVDRAFSVTGAGTVAAGAVLAGMARVGDQIVISPKGIQARIRGIQCGGRAFPIVHAGERCALNLAGIELADVHRGDVIIVAEMHAPTICVEACVSVLSEQPFSLKHNMTVHCHLHTADMIARVLISGQKAITAGETRIVRLLLDDPTQSVVGDHFILRDQSGKHLIGGGHVIDPLASTERRRNADHIAIGNALDTADPADALGALLALGRLEIDTQHFARRFNLTASVARELFATADIRLFGKMGTRALSKGHVENISAAITKMLGDFHTAQPDRHGLLTGELRKQLVGKISQRVLDEILKDLSDRGLVEISGSLVKLPGHAAHFNDAENAIWSDVREWRGDGDLRPFTVEDAVRSLRLREPALKAIFYRRCLNGDLFQLDQRRYLMRDQLGILVRMAAEIDTETGFAAAAFRDISGIGRNRAIIVLEYFDHLGLTVRQGDDRKLKIEKARAIGLLE